jgi:PEGA domain
MKLTRICGILVCAALVALPASAQVTEADRATARALALEGHTALQKRDFQTAADRFGRADTLVHAPTLVVDWARALQGLGRFVEAHEKYELVLREGIPEGSPKSWNRALEDAKKELEALKPRLGWITVVLLEPAEATVKIDGLPVPPAAVGVKRAADPGFPEVTVTAPGYEPFQQTMTVGPGEEKTLEVSLVKLPEQPKPRATSDAATPRAPVDPVRRATSYALLGLGTAGLVVGSVTGGLFFRKRSVLAAECDGEVCQPPSQKRIDTYRLYGTLSPIALGVGVASFGTGLVLLLTEQRRSPQTASGVHVRPLIAVGAIGAEGTF